MKITKITMLSKEVCIDFSDKESLKILINTFLDFSLFENKEITNDEYNEIKEKDSYFRLKDYAFYLLKFRDYCEKEMETSLYKYNQNINYVHKIIDDLKKNNYLNDESYVRFYVEKMEIKKCSKARIIQDLKQLEIPDLLIFEALKDYDEVAILNDKIVKLFNQIYKKKTFENTKKEVFQKCLYEGFETNNILEVLNNLKYDYDENIDHDNIMLLNDYNKIKRTFKNNCLNKEDKVKLIRKLTQKGHSYENINELIRKDELNYD